MLQDIYDFFNSTAIPARIAVEPWGEVYEVAPGELLRFVAASSQPGVFEAEASEAVTVLTVWPGASVEVFRDGKSIDYLDETTGDHHVAPVQSNPAIAFL